MAIQCSDGRVGTRRCVLRFDAAEIVLRPGDRVVVGSAPAAVAGAIPVHVTCTGEESIDESHAIVSFDGERITVQDLDTWHGTRLVDGDWVQHLRAETAVPYGSQMEFGAVMCTIDVDDLARSGGTTPART